MRIWPYVLAVMLLLEGCNEVGIARPPKDSNSYDPYSGSTSDSIPFIDQGTLKGQRDLYGSSYDRPKAVTQTVVVNEANNSSTTKLAVGAQFTINLQANHTKASQWVLADTPNPAVISLVSSHYQASAFNQGAGGTDTWVFHAVSPGTAIIVLTNQNPLTPQANSSNYVVTVVVN